MSFCVREVEEGEREGEGGRERAGVYDTIEEK
jgi:hypothetical protein